MSFRGITQGAATYTTRELFIATTLPGGYEEREESNGYRKCNK